MLHWYVFDKYTNNKILIIKIIFKNIDIIENYVV